VLRLNDVPVSGANKHNLSAMLSGLRRPAAAVPLVGMSYYDPLLGDWLAGGKWRAAALATVPRS
jgi:hypothetical protein